MCNSVSRQYYLIFQLFSDPRCRTATTLAAHSVVLSKPSLINLKITQTGLPNLSARLITKRSKLNTSYHSRGNLMDVSGISYGGLSRSSVAERLKNNEFLRKLYFLVLVEMVVALLWSVWVREHDRLGNGVYDYWGFALASAIIALLLLLVATFVQASRNSPLNVIIYALYTIFAAYTWGYLCAWDQRNDGWDFIFYWCCLLTGIATVLLFQVL